METIEEVSTITSKGQTTIPKSVRSALGVDFGDKIAFRVQENGVTVHRVGAGEERDPVLEQFLAFLAKDITQRPEALKGLTQAQGERIARLTEGVEVDFDAPIEGDVEL